MPTTVPTWWMFLASALFGAVCLACGLAYRRTHDNVTENEVPLPDTDMEGAYRYGRQFGERVRRSSRRPASMEADLRRIIGDLTAERDHLTARRDELLDEVAAVTARYDTTRAERDAARTERDRAMEDLLDAQNDMREMHDQLAILEAELAEAKAAPSQPGRQQPSKGGRPRR